MKCCVRRAAALLVCAVIALMSGCGTAYETGMYSDVRDFDFYESAVRLCVNEGYLVREGEEFGAYDTLSLSECAEIAAKLDGKSEKMR